MSVDLLFLNNLDMRKAGASDMESAIHDVEQAYILTAKGDIIAPGKCVMRWGDTPEDENVYGRINAMPGYIGGEYNMAGIKWIGSGPLNYKKGLPRASTIIILNDSETKLPICIADGTEVSSKRTGAGGGVAMKLLSRIDSTIMTIVGAGAQGRTQLEAAMIVRQNLNKIYVYDIRTEVIEKFIAEMSPLYPSVEMIAVTDLAVACSESDIIVCATLADEPIIHSAWLKRGVLLMNLADFEVTYNCVKKADKIVVDNWDTIKHRMISTVALMHRDGLIADKDIHANLGQLLLEEKVARENDDEIIYFNAVGTGILDIAITTRCYKVAMEQGIGTTLNYWA